MRNIMPPKYSLTLICAGALLMANSAPRPDAAAPHDAAPASQQTPEGNIAPLIPLTSARLPGFAPKLAERLIPRGPEFWTHTSPDAALARLARSKADDRQSARWDYAMAQLGTGHAPAALGALDVMLGDDADMALVPAFRLARGAALAQMRRDHEAIAMLTEPLLASHPEACMWRMLALAHSQHHDAALAEVRCAVKAVNRRKVTEAAPFIRAASEAAIHKAHYRRALGWLQQLPDGDSAANLLRGKALIGLGSLPAGKLRLDRVRNSDNFVDIIAAEMTLVDALVTQRQMKDAEALKRTERILFLWRGGGVEERAMELAYELALRQQDGRAILRYGGMLIRYGNMGQKGAAILKTTQKQLFAVLSPESDLSLGDAAGLFWDNRDLAPTGPEGDRLLSLLANRLAQAGLYERAADLLRYQMRARAKDIEKGPVSEKVARYYLLSGYPGRALLALRETDQPAYPRAILDARHRVEAIALYQIGKTDRAISILEAMPDMIALRGEMLWRRRDWQGLIAKLGTLPSNRTLSAVEQAIILRYAVALAMTGREDGLAELRTKYGAAFNRLSSAAAFELLTGPVEKMTSASIAQAMAAIPSASVAGVYDDMLDQDRQDDDATLPSVPPAKTDMALASAEPAQGNAKTPADAATDDHK